MSNASGKHISHLYHSALFRETQMFTEKGIWEGIQVSMCSSTSVFPAEHQSKNVALEHLIPQTTRITPLTFQRSRYRPNHPDFRLDFRAQNPLSIVKKPTNNYFCHPSSTSSYTTTTMIYTLLGSLHFLSSKTTTRRPTTVQVH